MVTFTDNQKVDYVREILPSPEEPEVEEPEEGLRLHCYMFLSLHGTNSKLLHQCKRSLLLTEDDSSPLSHGWYYWGNGWLCSTCKIAADRAYERYQNRPLTLEEVTKVFG